MSRKIGLAVFLAVLVFVIAGCQQEKQQVQEKQETSSPVDSAANLSANLLFFLNQMAVPEELDTAMKGFSQKYPNIHVELKHAENDFGLEQLIATGTVPDLILDGTTNDLFGYKDKNLLFDLRDLIKKTNFDLKQLDSVSMDTIGMYGEHGEIYALPFTGEGNATYINKNLFNQFGEPLPKDGMTWEEIIGAAKKMSRVDGGKTYYGLNADWYIRLASQLSLPYVDAKTNKAIVTDARWQKLAGLWKQIYEIPNNLPDDKSIQNGKQLFLDQTLAMWTGNTPPWEQFEKAEKNGLDWDMVSFPTFKEAPGIGRSPKDKILTISPTSKNKDAAFLVLAFLDSHETLLQIAKSGKVVPTADKSILDHFGEDIPVLKGKNIQALFKLKSALPPKPTSVFDAMETSGRTSPGKQAFDEIAKGTKDINTALREWEEQYNKQIADQNQ
ncbi:MAG: extracellular solute-binding protein family 1 [Paenibacillaceae bacterium]|nr:extracellular solute-binding protein family 1 [Paenibacillaceae bacterium]